MFVIGLIAGFLLGLAGFNNAIKITLCLGTTYAATMYFLPKTAIWSLEDYDNVSNYVSYFTSIYVFVGSALFLGSWFLFYFIVAKLFYLLCNYALRDFESNMSPYITADAPRRFIRRLINRVMKVVIKITMTLSVKKPSKEMSTDDGLSFNDYKNNIVAAICFCLHFLTCWAFIESIQWISLMVIIAICVAVLLLAFIFSPIIGEFKHEINAAYISEHNRYVR